MKEREFFKILKACDAISDCMDKESGVIEDFKQLEKELKEILEWRIGFLLKIEIISLKLIILILRFFRL